MALDLGSVAALAGRIARGLAGRAAGAALVIDHPAAPVDLNPAAIQDGLPQHLPGALNARLGARKRQPFSARDLALRHAVDLGPGERLTVRQRKTAEQRGETPRQLSLGRLSSLCGRSPELRRQLLDGAPRPVVIDNRIAGHAVEPTAQMGGRLRTLELAESPEQHVVHDVIGRGGIVDPSADESHELGPEILPARQRSAFGRDRHRAQAQPHEVAAGAQQTALSADAQQLASSLCEQQGAVEAPELAARPAEKRRRFSGSSALG